MIHHLSYPAGSSVNDHIDPKNASVQYTSFDEAVKMIQVLGRNCKIFKVDIKNAFKLLPIRPEDFGLLGYTFKERFYVEKTLPFVASISSSIFERFSTFFEFCVKAKARSGMLIHYLDDFLH